MHESRGTFGLLDAQDVDKAIPRVHALNHVIAPAQLEGPIHNKLELILSPAF